MHRLLSLSIVETSFVASYCINTLNVIYHSHISIQLACLPQKYVHLSPYTSLITRNTEECFKKIITMKLFSRNHQLRGRLPPSFMLVRRGFVRRNFIGHHGWNGRESTNQLQQHISHIATLYFLFHHILVHNLTICPGFCPVMVILNISPSSLPP